MELPAVEIDQAEAGGLEQATRHLVLLTCDGHAHEFRLFGLPLRASATGVRTRHPPLRHSHDVHLLAQGRRAHRTGSGNWLQG